MSNSCGAIAHEVDLWSMGVMLYEFVCGDLLAVQHSSTLLFAELCCQTQTSFCFAAAQGLKSSHAPAHVLDLLWSIWSAVQRKATFVSLVVLLQANLPFADDLDDPTEVCTAVLKDSSTRCEIRDMII